jgi:hypothetical protein
LDEYKRNIVNPVRVGELVSQTCYRYCRVVVWVEEFLMAITLIAHTEVGSGGAANIEFTSIPSTYDDLWIVLSARLSLAGSNYAEVALRFNGVTTTSYSRTTLTAFSSTVNSGRATNSSSYLHGTVPAADANSNIFGSSSIYIPAYANTSNNKQIISESNGENNSTTAWSNQYTAGLFRSTSAISSITIFRSSTTFVQYSTATLYGIKKF